MNIKYKIQFRIGAHDSEIEYCKTVIQTSYTIQKLTHVHSTSDFEIYYLLFTKIGFRIGARDRQRSRESEIAAFLSIVGLLVVIRKR